MTDQTPPHAALLALAALLLSAACTPPDAPQTAPERTRIAADTAQEPTPPPLPEDRETVDFERPDPTPAPAPTDTAAPEDSTPPATTANSPYWGIAPGEPLPIMWDDLMPEGSEEELLRQQEEFYRMIEQRYSANTTRLADAANALEAIEEGSDLDYMPQFGTFDVVEDLNGELIRIPGYVVPFDFNLNKRHSEFLLVPYMGACIHTPPPPPNQIIYVRADPAVRIKDIWIPYWIEGTLKGEEVLNDTGDAAYSLTLDKIEDYPMP